jgi:hypothetical protein
LGREKLGRDSFGRGNPRLGGLGWTSFAFLAA